MQNHPWKAIRSHFESIKIPNTSHKAWFIHDYVQKKGVKNLSIGDLIVNLINKR